MQMMMCADEKKRTSARRADRGLSTGTVGVCGGKCVLAYGTLLDTTKEDFGRRVDDVWQGRPRSEER